MGAAGGGHGLRWVHAEAYRAGSTEGEPARPGIAWPDRCRIFPADDPLAPCHRSPPFVDLHNHLVPGVDDGAATVAGVARRAAHALRRRRPHPGGHAAPARSRVSPRMAAIGRELDLQRRAFDRLAEAAAREHDLPALGLGQEIWAPDAAALRAGRRRGPTSAWAARARMLVEFGFELPRHPRRRDPRPPLDGGPRDRDRSPGALHYPAGLEPLDVMRRWRELGALLQVNAGSFTGHYRDHRPESESLAWAMVAEGLVDIVGDRPPRTAAGRRLAAGGVRRRCAPAGEQALAERAMVERPGAVLRDEAVEERRRRPSGRQGQARSADRLQQVAHRPRLRPRRRPPSPSPPSPMIRCPQRRDTRGPRRHPRTGWCSSSPCRSPPARPARRAGCRSLRSATRSAPPGPASP